MQFRENCDKMKTVDGVSSVTRKRKLGSLQRATGSDRERSVSSDAAAATAETTPTASAVTDGADADVVVPLYRAEGLLAVDKPLNWTSQDVVSYVRGILERDARHRGAAPVKVGSRRNKGRIVKVGHGGTLDPLASGVLVLGVGRGTKDLTKYLQGSKAYRATGRLGVETTTLDLDPTANVTKTKAWDHVSHPQIAEVLPKFVGKIQQIPPVFSAKRQGGKKAYEIARKEGVDSVEMEAKEVEIYRLELLMTTAEEARSEAVASEEGEASVPTLDPVAFALPDFTIAMECGGGTFVRSLIRDIGYEVDTVATTALLQRTKQGPFELEDCLVKSDWTADEIYTQINKWTKKLAEEDH